MGVTSLGSHASGKNIQKFRSPKAQILGQHFLASRTQENLRLTTKIQTVKKVKKSKRAVESILVPVNTLQAEVASSHISLRSCLGLNELFWSMFTDSEIFKQD